jgi:tRNA threonylcarbamoyl adenosine modification protein YeaZ
MILALDTSTPAVTVAVAEVVAPQRGTRHQARNPHLRAEGGWVGSARDGITILAARTEVAPNRQGELLAPMTQEVLEAAGAGPADLGAVAVGLGPGPFTGLRVGIVTACATADALAIPAYGESSLQLFAGQAVATDARRKQVYWAVAGVGRFKAGPDIGTPEQAAAAFADAEVRQVSGEGPRLYPQAFAGFVDRDRPYPDPERLVAMVAARALAGAPSDDLAPMYLRRPDARPPGRPKPVTPT